GVVPGAGFGGAVRDRRRGAVYRHGPLRPLPDPRGVVRFRDAGAAAELLRAGRPAAQPPRGDRQPVLPFGAGLGVVPDDRAAHAGYRDRLAGGDLRRVHRVPAGDPARLPATHAGGAHLARGDRADLPAVGQPRPDGGGDRHCDRLPVLQCAGRRVRHRGDRHHGDRYRADHDRGAPHVAVEPHRGDPHRSAVAGDRPELLRRQHAEDSRRPLVLGVLLFTVMTTWRRGRELVVREIKQGGLALAPFIENMTEHPPMRVPGTAVFLTANQEAVPHALLHNLKHNKVLHERNVLLTVAILETPVADAEERIHISRLSDDFYSLELRFGFAEDPNIPLALSRCTREGLGFDMMDTTFFLSRESIVSSERRPGMAPWRDKLFAFMARNALPATAFFQIPGNRLIELGAQVEI